VLGLRFEHFFGIEPEIAGVPMQTLKRLKQLPQRVGIFGFKCDPPHVFHMLLAERARVEHNLDIVLLVPAGQPTDKTTGVTPKRSRLRLVRAAIKGNPYFKVSTVEIDREGPSYTADTLRALEAQYAPGTEFFLIIGEDRAPTIKDWREPDVVVQKCTILCGPRFTGKVSTDWLQSVLPPGARCGTVEINNSSTFIRDEIAKGHSVRYLVDENTLREIKWLDLYRESHPDKPLPDVAPKRKRRSPRKKHKEAAGSGSSGTTVRSAKRVVRKVPGSKRGKR
jgi:nicotinate-nucleotide adenylyltransferase